MEQGLIGFLLWLLWCSCCWIEFNDGSSLKPCKKVIVYQTTSKKWAIPLHNFVYNKSYTEHNKKKIPDYEVKTCIVKLRNWENVIQ